MKIAFIINSMGGGGAERVVSTLARRFHAQGHQVEIVTLHDEKCAYELPSDVVVHTLASGRLLRSIGKIALLPVTAFELARVLEEIAPDAAISFLTRANLTHVLTRWFGNRKRIHISERINSELEYVGSKRVLGILLRLLYPKADHIIAISRGVQESLARFAVSRGKITTIYNPQDLDAIRSAAQRKRAPFTVVMAGRLTRQKDYPTMLRAMTLLVHARRLDVRLMVLGEGPDRANLEEMTRELDLADRVEWRGWIADIHRIMADCNAFAMTSIYEGFGNVLVEAMACGLPVISTNAQSGPTEILDGGKYGFLVPVGDASTIADAVQALMSHPEVHAEYARRARVGAERFDVATIGESYLQVLRSHSAPAEAGTH